METIMRCICSYCKNQYGIKDGQGQEGDSHGICPDCLKKEFPDYAERLNIKVPCLRCHGTGVIEEDHSYLVECPDCHKEVDPVIKAAQQIRESRPIMGGFYNMCNDGLD
jgi:hypothetical protein